MRRDGAGRGGVRLSVAESIRGQLEGIYPSTLAQQAEQPGNGVDASHVDLGELGDFQDLKVARERQDAARKSIT